MPATYSQAGLVGWKWADTGEQPGELRKKAQRARRNSLKSEPVGVLRVDNGSTADTAPGIFRYLVN
jgi:hypothetical protein